MSENSDLIVKVKSSFGVNPAVDQPTTDPMLTNFFGINNLEVTNADRVKLSEVEDYLSDIEDPMEKVTALKDMRFRMGAPRLGTSELEHFHKYVRIRNSIKSKEAELKALER